MSRFTLAEWTQQMPHVPLSNVDGAYMLCRGGQASMEEQLFDMLFWLA